MEYMKKFGFMEKTGIDLAGEATGIIHKAENVGPVELATMSFGQSFQITPMQMAATVSSIINGGLRITPHFGIAIENQDGKVLKLYGTKPEHIAADYFGYMMDGYEITVTDAKTNELLYRGKLKTDFVEDYNGELYAINIGQRAKLDKI